MPKKNMQHSSQLASISSPEYVWAAKLHRVGKLKQCYASWYAKVRPLGVILVQLILPVILVCIYGVCLNEGSSRTQVTNESDRKYKSLHLTSLGRFHLIAGASGDALQGIVWSLTRMPSTLK